MIEDIYILKWEYEIYFDRHSDGQARLVTVVDSKSTAEHIIDYLSCKFGVTIYYRLVKKVVTFK